VRKVTSPACATVLPQGWPIAGLKALNQDTWICPCSTLITAQAWPWSWIGEPFPEGEKKPDRASGPVRSVKPAGGRKPVGA